MIPVSAIAPGDHVRILRPVWTRGVVKVAPGTEGVFREFWRARGGGSTFALVDFPDNPRQLTSVHNLEIVAGVWNPTGDARADRVKARDLMHAHEKVAEAYKALMYAFDHLQEVEHR